MRLLFVFLLVIISFKSLCQYDTTVIKSEWTYVGRDQDGRAWYIDSNIIKKVGSEITIWIKIGGVSFENNGRLYKDSTEKEKVVIDCQDKKIMILASVYYDYKGNIINSDEFDMNSREWRSVVPESIGSSVLEMVCDKYGKLFYK